ncbi:MAG TPA: hypothetical protein VGL71_02220 [Urbifossiella sp.]|jgi:hypothetical protein
MILLGLGTAAAIAILFVSFSRPPRMGADRDVFKTVDALYTAVGLKDALKVTECERRLHQYRDEGKLPVAAARHLDRVIATTRAESWESAQESLYEFMLVQRREK